MEKLNLSVTGFTGEDKVPFNGAKLEYGEKDGFTAVYVKADAEDKFFTASRGAAVKIDEPSDTVR